jgi:hypothetical protein
MRPDKDLLDRLDAATVGGPRFDWEIAEAHLQKRKKEVVERGAVFYIEVWITRDSAEHRTPPAFTTSLDAALLLYDQADVPAMVPSDPLVACRQALHVLENRALAILRE